MYTCRRHAHTLEQAADHTTCPVTAPLCALNLTALLVRSVVGRTPGTVCFALAAHLTSRGIGLGHCVSPPRISELERHRKLPPVRLTWLFFPSHISEPVAIVRARAYRRFNHLPLDGSTVLSLGRLRRVENHPEERKSRPVSWACLTAGVCEAWRRPHSLDG
jgi:hypothetical protein